jgi:hypothetical protein
MGRLSTSAKNRILNLRFQKSFRIKQIAQTLLQENDIKVVLRVEIHYVTGCLSFLFNLGITKVYKYILKKIY